MHDVLAQEEVSDRLASWNGAVLSMIRGDRFCASVQVNDAVGGKEDLG